MHVRFEIKQFVDMCIFKHTMNYQIPRPRMLQMKFELKRASGFNLILKEMMFGCLDVSAIFLGLSKLNVAIATKLKCLP